MLASRVLLIVILSTAIFCCNKKSDVPRDPAVIYLTDGSWRIDKFIFNNEETTSDFLGYVFIFGSDGRLVASRDNSTIQGSWSSGYTGGENLFTGTHYMNIMFSTPQQFENLSGKWDFFLVSPTEVSVDSGNITFAKN